MSALILYRVSCILGMRVFLGLCLLGFLRAHLPNYGGQAQIVAASVKLIERDLTKMVEEFAFCSNPPKMDFLRNMNRIRGAVGELAAALGGDATGIVKAMMGLQIQADTLMRGFGSSEEDLEIGMERMRLSGKKLNEACGSKVAILRLVAGLSIEGPQEKIPKPFTP